MLFVCQLLRMLLYSIQPRFVYDTLCNSGVFQSRPQNSGNDWTCADMPAAQFAYDWLCGEMERRGLTRPAADIYPVWAWRQYMGKDKPKPDLRHSGMKHWANDGRQVLLSLDLPDDRVLLHDYDAWHFPLNYFYLGTQRSSERFERRCKAAGSPL